VIAILLNGRVNLYRKEETNTQQLLKKGKIIPVVIKALRPPAPWNVF